MKRFSDAGSIPAASTKLKCAAAKAATIPVYRDIAVYRDFFVICLKKEDTPLQS